MSDKPREFWILSSPTLGTLCVEDSEEDALRLYDEEKRLCGDSATCVHVIEYSAYEQVVKERDTMKKILIDCLEDSDISLNLYARINDILRE